MFPQGAVGREGFDGEDVQARITYLAVMECSQQGRLVHNCSSSNVYKHGFGPHGREDIAADELFRIGRARKSVDKGVCGAEEFLQLIVGADVFYALYRF